ncbi:MAG: hypothetical protein AB7G11_07735 [Phycisphaerales bacterium]
MRTSNKIGWLIAGVCAAVVVVSAARMSARVDEYNRHSGFPHFRFEVMGNREFTAYGRPVRIQDDADENGHATLRVTYGDTVAEFPVKTPPARDVPSMGIYDEWAKAIEVHEVGRTEHGELGDKVGSGRVVLVIRRTKEGLDPETWGSVFRDAWTFDFHEFEPDGTFRTESYRWPRGEMGEMTLKRLVKEGNEEAKALVAIPELPERGWQYQTALHVIPKLNVPKYRFKDTAIKAMGWTLPAAGFGGLGVIIGVCMGFAPARVRQDDDPRAPHAAPAGSHS